MTRFDIRQLQRELLGYLTLVGPASAADARRHLGISQPVFSRLVARIRDELVVAGRARATRYAARRLIADVGGAVPIYEVDEVGKTTKLATLKPIQQRGFYVESEIDRAASGFFDDLPYFLHDMRPSGFLGRLIPKRHPELELPSDVRIWSADHCLAYLTRHAWSSSGNLILGDEAFKLFLAHTLDPPDEVAMHERQRRYPALAANVLEAGVAGSSAAGEQPKFLAVRTPGPTPVMVKFSPPVGDATGERLADLLVCELIAHEVIAAHDLPASKSELVVGGEQIFLEIERFDRVGSRGRRGLISLTALDSEYVGSSGKWSVSAAGLLTQKLIDNPTYHHIRWLGVFGGLIANTDMHPGNLSFLTQGLAIDGLAPAYDMLPMLYAPRDGHLLTPRFDPPLPTPDDSIVWRDAWRAASDFWSRVRTHDMVSKVFRDIATTNAKAVAGLKSVAEQLP